MGETPFMTTQSEEILKVNLTISGKVQGVGFRYFVLRQAQELGILGWVSNKPNGDVEAFAQGEKADLERFIAKVKEGPSFSRVEDVSLNWVKEAEQYFGFEII
jgi:acylphosphatase